MRITLFLLLVSLSGASFAANFSVINNSDSGAGSLRQAILDANTAGGINEITFSVPFTANSSILLQSALPTITTSELTIFGSTRLPRIDGQNLHAILRVSGALTRLTLNDLTLRNGKAVNDGACINGRDASASALLSFARIVVDNCHITDVSLVYGGAIRWQGDQLVIIDSVITNNSSTASGATGQSGGGAIYSSATTSIVGTLFSGNAVLAGSPGSGGTGGAILLRGDNRSHVIRDSTFMNNGASVASAILGYGGGINLTCNNCALNAYRNYYRGNSANYGGAIYASKSSGGTLDVTLSVTNSTFYNNSVLTSGGAIHLTRGILTASNSTFYNNDSNTGAHLGFAALNDIIGFRANLFAPTYAGSACSDMSSVTVSDGISANLLSDASCTGIINESPSIPNTPLGLISVDESPGVIGVVKFTGSAVIDSLAPTSCEPFDARYVARPIDGDDDGNALCDVGAFEHPNPTLFRNGFE